MNLTKETCKCLTCKHSHFVQGTKSSHAYCYAVHGYFQELNTVKINEQESLPDVVECNKHEKATSVQSV
jgi:hypothetical protein